MFKFERGRVFQTRPRFFIANKNLDVILLVQTEYEKRMPTADLTSEQIVTKLLSSNEILRRQKGNFYINNPAIDTLGEFLAEHWEPPVFEEKEVSRFVFIK